MNVFCKLRQFEGSSVLSSSNLLLVFNHFFPQCFDSNGMDLGNRATQLSQQVKSFSSRQFAVLFGENVHLLF